MRGMVTSSSEQKKEIDMKRTVLTFGLISGVMISVLMGGSLLIADKIGSGHSMVLGYTMMVASFLLIYFGIRSYRDNTLGGQITFGRAFVCGILIALITTVCYVAMWEVLYFNFMPHFMDSYFAAQIHKVQSSGLDQATIAAKVAARQRSQQLYRSYRDNTLAGQISFGRAFGCGLLITKTPSSTWPTPSWSPCPSALSLLSSPLPSSAAKASVEPTAALAVMTT